ncbi:MAG: hypothetical protein HC882_01445 [Acidobacteria bacterium]|nr:hypothetical protein [Acidobacteriota bacterium]
MLADLGRERLHVPGRHALLVPVLSDEGLLLGPPAKPEAIGVGAMLQRPVEFLGASHPRRSADAIRVFDYHGVSDIHLEDVAVLVLLADASAVDLGLSNDHAPEPILLLLGRGQEDVRRVVLDDHDDLVGAGYAGEVLEY